MREVFILAGARTPFALWSAGKRPDGAPGGALKSVGAFDLGAAALRGALDRSGLAEGRLDQVVFGNMYHAGPHACYGARYVGWRAGLPPEIPCLTVSMACGSGLHAIISGAQSVAAGAGAVCAGGADNVSLVRRDVFVPSFTDLSCGLPIGRTVEALCGDYRIGREDADRWALRSHERAARARAEGLLAPEIVPVSGAAEDDAVNPALGMERLSGEAPLYGEGGVVTKSNSHAVADGGSALILASEDLAREAGGPPLGRVAGWAYSAAPPDRMAVAAVPAARLAVERAGWRPSDVDLFEINETFSAQVLMDVRELGIDPERVNVSGGAVALGHAFAATGCRQALSLLLELRRRGLRRGLASICVGGGQGVAVALERL